MSANANAFFQIVSTLQSAGSQDQNVRVPAEEQLKQWETAPTFYSTLQVCDSSKWQERCAKEEILQGIDVIQPDEKAKIRAKLIQSLDEPDKKLATQNAVAIAKIARLDYPNDWPDLLHILMQTIQSTFSPDFPSTTPAAQDPNYVRLMQQHSLYALHQVVKTLCSKTLAPSRRMLEQLAPEIFRYISNIFYDRANHFLALADALISGSSVDWNEFEASVRIARLALKCLRRLIVHGFQAFEKVEVALTLFRSLLDYLPKYLHLRRIIQKAPGSLFHAIDTSILLIGKFYIDLQSNRLVHFVLAPGALDVVRFYWGMVEGYGGGGGQQRDDMYERFLVQGLILLKNLIKNPSFNIVSPTPNSLALREQSQHLLRTTLLTPPAITSLLRTLIVHYLPLRVCDDLETWEDDPEAFVGEEVADHWEYALRACAEKVLMDLVSENRETLCPVLVEMLQKVSEGQVGALLGESGSTTSASGTATTPAGVGPVVPGDGSGGATQQHTDPALSALLVKDAVYNACGLAANDLHDYVDFDSWFAGRLGHEAVERSVGGALSKILRRRVVWLIGRWIPIKVSKPTRAQIYPLVLSLMVPEEDMVVRLTA
ncbi:Importin-11, partial [Quaeritorhiza haematococci]